MNASPTYPWPSTSATGLGPCPGTDPLEAARVVVGELPDLPFLPALPARGVGSDAVGRTAALLVDLHVDVQPGGWRLVPRPGRDEGRARAALLADLDAMEEAAEGYQGPFKVQLLGPWTLAASLALPRGEKALADEGAVRDLGVSLAEGVALHLADVRRRLPGVADLVVQLDEPLLGAVLGGEVPTQSGWGRLRAVEERVTSDLLGDVVGAAGDHVGVRTGDRAEAPVALVRKAGARFLGVDAGALSAVPEDDLGEALEDGMGLLVAVVPLENDGATPASIVDPLVRLWRRLGLPPERLPEAVAVTPVEGIERVALEDAAAVLRRAVEVGRFLEKAAE